MKRNEKRVFIELLKNGRRPDKHIAKSLEMAQPTVTRIRQRLEKQKHITSYSPSVNLGKVGINLAVITLFRISDFTKTESMKKTVIPYLNKMPQVVCVAEGEGLRGKTSMIISMHKDFQDYQDMMLDLRKRFGKNVGDIEQFIVSADKIYKDFSLNALAIDILSKELKG
jgi:DNA-binding Lrp family transcriptional regulator